MTNIQIFQKTLLKQLLRQYNLPEQVISSQIKENLLKNTKLVNLIDNIKELDSIKKRKEFKQFYKNLKRKLYYQARTYYKENADNPILEHASTAERQQSLKKFIDPLKNILKNAKTIVDIGAGVFPLQLSAKNIPNIQTYVAIDKDKKAITTLQNSKIQWLKPIHTKIESINWQEVITSYLKKQQCFDVAFLLKTIPVAIRLGKDTTQKILAETPAQIIIISGNRFGLAKKNKIEYRERKTILNFLKNTNWEILSQYKTIDEIIFILKNKNC